MVHKTNDMFMTLFILFLLVAGVTFWWYNRAPRAPCTHRAHNSTCFTDSNNTTTQFYEPSTVQTWPKPRRHLYQNTV